MQEDAHKMETEQSANGAGDDAAGTGGALEQLEALRRTVQEARSVPMSASCVVNRADTLASLDAIIAALPTELEQAQGVMNSSGAKVAEGEAEAQRIVNEARDWAAQMAGETSVAKEAEAMAAKTRAAAEADATALRTETDAFIDSRMASFESVLHKTTSQVKTARHRLSERSKLDDAPAGEALPDLD